MFSLNNISLIFPNQYFIPHLGKMWYMLKMVTFQPHPLKKKSWIRPYIAAWEGVSGSKRFRPFLDLRHELIKFAIILTNNENISRHENVYSIQFIFVRKCLNLFLKLTTKIHRTCKGIHLIFFNK